MRSYGKRPVEVQIEEVGRAHHEGVCNFASPVRTKPATTSGLKPCATSTAPVQPSGFRPEARAPSGPARAFRNDGTDGFMWIWLHAEQQDEVEPLDYRPLPRKARTCR
jgi:hypothetical protein